MGELDVLNLKQGMKIRFIGNMTRDQIRYSHFSNPRGVLKKGSIYTLERVEASNWYANIYIEGIDGCFNYVWFESAE